MKRDNPLAEDLELILSNTYELWNDLREGRLFVTGGTGFFGCWLLESFIWANEKLNLNAKIVVLTRNADVFKKKSPHLANNIAVSLQTGDVRTFKFPKGAFSHIIHAATESSTNLNSRDPLLMFDTIVQGTRHTLDFAVHCGAKKLLFTSSGAVYGKQPSELTHIPEDYQGAPDPTNPRSTYGEAKRVAELLCTLYSRKYRIEGKIARCFAFVGPYLPIDIHFAVGNFVRDGLRGGPIQVKGDGTPYRSYLYAADLAIWLWTILFKGESYRPYNVGSEVNLTIGELANVVAKSFQPERKVHIAKQATHGKAPERYVPSTQRAQLELGLKQNIGLQEAILKYLQKYKP